MDLNDIAIQVNRFNHSTAADIVFFGSLLLLTVRGFMWVYEFKVDTTRRHLIRGTISVLGCVWLVTIVIEETTERIFESAYEGTVFRIDPATNVATKYPDGHLKGSDVWRLPTIFADVEKDFGPFEINPDAHAFATLGLKFALIEPAKYVKARALKGGGDIAIDPEHLLAISVPAMARTTLLKGLLDDGETPENIRMQAVDRIVQSALDERLKRFGLEVRATKLQYTTRP